MYTMLNRKTLARINNRPRGRGGRARGGGGDLARRGDPQRARGGVRQGHTGEESGASADRGRPPGDAGHLGGRGRVWDPGRRHQPLILPECVLVYEDDRYRAVSYEAFGVVYAPSRVAETGEAPADAEVVGETWRYVTEDGRPDRRRSSNPRYPIVAYGMPVMTGLAAGAAGLGGPTGAAKS